MEKRAIIEEGWTPPVEEKKEVKEASTKDLAEHVTKRVADQAEKKLKKTN